MTDEEALAHMRRVRERLWRAKHPTEHGAMGKTGTRKPSARRRARPGEAFEELYRLAAEEGTACDGMTDQQIVAHMRRVRDALWKAEHAGRARRQ